MSNLVCVETHKEAAVVVAEGATDPAKLDWLAAAIWLSAASILAEAVV